MKKCISSFYFYFQISLFLNKGGIAIIIPGINQFPPTDVPSGNTDKIPI